MNALIPNTFQCFNLYIDRAMEHLTDSEVRILWYTTRHILGWQDRLKKRHGHISISMFEHGYTTEGGKHYGGCGLGRGAIIAACSKLVEFKFLAKIGQPTDDGQEWELTTDDIQWGALEARTAAKNNRLKKQTKGATQARKAKRASTSNVPPKGGTSNDTTPSTSNDTTPSTSNVPNQSPSSKPSPKPSHGKRLPLPMKFPTNVYAYTHKHIVGYQEQHEADMVALVQAWAGEMYKSITEFADRVAKLYIEVHHELDRLHIPPTEYTELIKFTKAKEHWRGGRKITDILSYTHEYKKSAKSAHNGATGKSQAELDAQMAHEYEEMFGDKYPTAR